MSREVGLYRARYYSPTYQRFISEDPIGLADGINLYAYAGNDPVNRVDPSGEFVCGDELYAHGVGHLFITFTAAITAGYNSAQAWALADRVCNVDWEPHSWSRAPQYTHKHALAGRKDNGRYEPCGQAYTATKQLLGQYIRAGDAVHASHLVQDAWPSGHYGFQPWYGAPGAQHMEGDVSPDQWRVDAATDATERLLRDMLNHNTGDPSEYLPNNPCGP